MVGEDGLKADSTRTGAARKSFDKIRVSGSLRDSFCDLEKRDGCEKRKFILNFIFGLDADF